MTQHKIFSGNAFHDVELIQEENRTEPPYQSYILKSGMLFFSRTAIILDAKGGLLAHSKRLKNDKEALLWLKKTTKLLAKNYKVTHA